MSIEVFTYALPGTVIEETFSKAKRSVARAQLLQSFRNEDRRRRPNWPLHVRAAVKIASLSIWTWHCVVIVQRAVELARIAGHEVDSD